MKQHAGNKEAIKTLSLYRVWKKMNVLYEKLFYFLSQQSVQRVRLLLTLWMYLALPSNGTLHFTLASLLALTVSNCCSNSF